MKPQEIYEKQTGVRAMYRVNGADWHTLKYVTWLEETNAKLIEALKGLLDIVSGSNGVAGFYLNGDIAKWGEFEGVGIAERAIAEAEGSHAD